jgi:hypothetical protein
VAVADEQKDQAVGPATDVAPGPGIPTQQRIRRARWRTADSRSGSVDSTTVGGAIAWVRSVLATAVFTAALLAALALALGAVLTALGANEDNTVVSGLLALAGRLDGPFADVFTFDSASKQLLVNWGIAAAVYLVVGRVVERLLRP